MAEKSPKLKCKKHIEYGDETDDNKREFKCGKLF